VTYPMITDEASYTCGRPMAIHNAIRTAYLLLTMANQPVPIAAAYGLSRLNTCSRQRRLAETSPAWLHSAPRLPLEMIFW